MIQEILESNNNNLTFCLHDWTTLFRFELPIAGSID